MSRGGNEELVRVERKWVGNVRREKNKKIKYKI